jgi:gamma-glutamyltranspeptidase/glutathione hydrolase
MEALDRALGGGSLRNPMIARFVVAGLLAVGSVGHAAEPLCKPDPAPPGTNGCLPTPLECSTGNFNGFWDGGVPDRAALCVGGANHVVQYTGGNGLANCGVIIDADHAEIGAWKDPNFCPPHSAAPGHGVPGRAFLPAVRSTGGVVASVAPDAAAAGIEILDKGGNAIDAAVAAVFAVGVARPEMCGIGGGGFLVYRSSRGETAALDFRETAPRALTAEKLRGPGLSTGLIGHTVIGVPGTVAGMAAALGRYGRKSLAEVIAPAEKLAREGIRVSLGLADGYFYSLVPREPALRLFPAAGAIYLDATGTKFPPYPISDKLVQSDYAASLRLIAAHGPDAFYRGRIAELIVADMEAARAPGDEGLITLADLAAYRAVWREPVVGRYRGHEVIGMPPPSGGGIFTIEVLNLVEGDDLRSMGHSSADHLHLLAEAQKIAWADRNRYAADPDFVSVPTARLTSKEYARTRRAEISRTEAKCFGAAETEEPSHTTHVSVVDREGNAVAVTCSLNEAFGSAVVAPGTGFPLNNHMGDFTDPLLEPGTVNHVEPGKRPRSSMSPTIVVEDGRAVLVAGGAGGTRIPMAVVLAVSNVVDFEMDVARAVDAARLDEPVCNGMVLEESRVLPEVRTELENRGHELTLRGEYDGLPHVELAADEGRQRAAASDPREDRGAKGQ